MALIGHRFGFDSDIVPDLPFHSHARRPFGRCSDFEINIIGEVFAGRQLCLTQIILADIQRVETDRIFKRTEEIKA